MRPTMSTLEPAENGMTARIGRVGQAPQVGEPGRGVGVAGAD